MADLFIHDARLPDGEPGDVTVREGRIAAIARGAARPPPPEGVDVIAGRGRWLLPGAIDMHVHFRQPGGEHKETLVSGARAAVKGGTTTCADMPNTSPRTTTLARLEEKVALAAGAPANLLFNFGAEPDNLDEARLAAGHPAVKAVKIYIGPSTGQGGLAPDAVEAHFRLAAETGLPVMVHAEDMELIAANDLVFPHEARHHGDLRSLEAELAAVRFALGLAAKHGCKLYLAHVTSAKVVELVADSGLGGQVLVEACPHHLLLATEQIAAPLENRYKVNPPLRPEAERAALFSALTSGIGCLGSDHAPHTLEEKALPYDDAPSGIPGVEYLFPLAIHWWREGKLSMERLLELTSGAAAGFFGLSKGAVAEGRDADLVLVDGDATWTLGAGDDRVASQCGWSLYEGMTLRGRPEVTIVGGRVVWERATR